MYRLLSLFAGLSFLVAANNPLAAQSQEQPPLERTWSVSLQAGMSSTFQMTLGGMFGQGPDVHNRLTVGLNNALLRNDCLSGFGWSTTDLPSSTPNWMAGFQYKAPVLTKARHKLALGGGMQRWLLPSVKTGAQDWLLAGALTYATKVKGIPIVVNQDSWSLLRSTLRKGSTLYTQVYSEHVLARHHGLRVLLRQGPHYSYSWGFYGADGNRVVRYGGSLVLAWKDTTLEGAYRQQFGLQDGIKYNRYWSFAFTRQITGKFGFGRND